MKRMKRIDLILPMILMIALASCSHMGQPLDRFSDEQRSKISEKTVYIQADFLFWTAVYLPTASDVSALKSAWQDHSQAFPESKALQDIEKELKQSTTQPVIVALFMTDYEKADLKNLNLGWSVHPVPVSVQELSDGDQVLRTLMPIKNPWARYFLLRYPRSVASATTEIVVGNRERSVTVPMAATQP